MFLFRNTDFKSFLKKSETARKESTLLMENIAMARRNIELLAHGPGLKYEPCSI